MEGKTLLVIPFESDTETAELHNDTCDRIYNAVGEITHAKNYRIAFPMKREDIQALILANQRNQGAGKKRKRSDEHLPGTFLIHSLSQVHYQMLLQQTVWASQTITF